MIIYKLFLKETNEPLGSASSKDMLTDLMLDLFFDDNIWSHQIRVEEIEKNE